MDVSYDINDDVKREVLAATDLVSLVGGATSLKKMGASWKGLCPFHGEKTPSFYVHPQKGFYYCFGCGAKGDAITFVRETERLDFPEAVAYLARLAGVTLPVRRGGSRAERSKDTRATEAVSSAARFFRAELPRHAGAKALLQRRGLTLEQAATFGFGAAPDGWEGLKNALQEFPEELLLATGLLTKNPESGRVYDRFRNRLTVEIRDPRGEILGFGARALGDDQPKYLNSPESTRFSKGKLLYGLDRAKDAIRTSGEGILCEGYFDRIAFERAGLANAVASMGTALTPVQADLLARHAPVVIVAYDGDDAGRAAAKKAFALLVSRGVAVKHLLFPGKHDPDSWLAEHGPEALRKAVVEATPLLDALLAEIPRAGGDANERSARINEALEIVNGAPDRLLRYELLSGLSRGTGIPVPVLAGDQGKKPATRTVEKPEDPSGARLDAPLTNEERVMATLLARWPESAMYAAGIPDATFDNPSLRAIAVGLKAMDASLPLDFSQLESHVGPDVARGLYRLLLVGAAFDLKELYKPLLRMKISYLEKRRAALLHEIEGAQRDGNAARQTELSRQMGSLSVEIRGLKAEAKQQPGALASGEGE